jgi:hypothetical protein
MAIALAAAVCLLGVTAGSALAHQFTFNVVGKTITPEAPVKMSAVGGTQAFKFNGGKIVCEKMSGKGYATSETSNILKLFIVFGKCYVPVKWSTGELHIAAHFIKKEPLKDDVEFAFHANGFAETGTEGEEYELEVGQSSAELKFGSKLCTIEWPAQTVPIKAEKKPEEEYFSAVYSNESVPNEHLKAFPSGFQEKLVIANTFKKMKYVYTEGQCSEFEKGTEGNTANYEGTTTVTLASGNVGWE